MQSTEPFLQGDTVSVEQRWQALRLNVEARYERLMQAGGDTVWREGAVMGTNGHMTIALHDPLQINHHLDRILDWYRGRHTEDGAICWYLHHEPPGDLGARLFARGFSVNWQPHWMWCDLDHFRKNDHPPALFAIQCVIDEPTWPVDDLPYYKPQKAPLLAALYRAYPRYAPAFVALQQDQIVGRCMLNITPGPWGIAGLFAMGVVPAARQQGIGMALVQAACAYARQLGCRFMMLNATAMGESVYRRVGFHSMGYGHSWFLSTQTLATQAPTRERVQFLEAVGMGDVATLQMLEPHLDQLTFSEPTPGNLTPLDIAVRCQQPGSAAWLVEHGISLDLLSAWDLGWKEQVQHLLAVHPELVNVRGGEWQATPLQIAIQRGDLDLARLLLTVPHDLAIEDGEFHSTAIGWARYFQRTEMLELLEQYS